MKTISLNRVTNALSENEMKSVEGGVDQVQFAYYDSVDDYGGGGGGLSQPCKPPKEGCAGPHGAYVPASGGLPAGVCCLGPFEGWTKRYCYAVLRGLYQCP